jgi:SAM-dependent methyltransferase
VVDAIFGDPRLARAYDQLDPDRSDLDVYAAVVDERGARSVLDIGCGTGTFACVLAARGIDVTGLDPAGAMLDVARSKPEAGVVQWIHGDVSALPPSLQCDAAFITGNAAMVFLTDADWAAVLTAAFQALRPGGWLVFESRVPERRAYEGWTPERTRRTFDIPDIGPVTAWEDLLDVTGDLVTFRTLVTFERTGESIESRSTLRFRTRAELEASLDAAGFALEEVRDAPDRPGLEHVFLSRTPTPARGGD